ncbi:TetR/AcrR family transcriptional regulator [Amycolatopsis sp. FDAARGOS 1241]|uniref:TetR/AcrR family transcriptional regulator n=1 Tax=Amycolatopsis sp. FDAARGOS 1241 TaxID=2778070 RepID=UPI00194FA868|nr:TetR/AcrR family transcriptional regulator [Amycolatopsis sp. FDAARGOS 1241]QRP43250.1 TetR/AcrR family transcriptional regulator [Amycolatopsis sp. FDAARGOS 1241]
MPTTRSEQRARTREHLLEATVGCLVEFGYAGTTTQRVQERAGVSRGALLHHFGSKADLFVAAIHHIAEQQLVRVRAAGAGARSKRDLVTALREAMSGSLFLAGLELWLGARTDPALRTALLPAERELGRELRETFESFGNDRIGYESLLVLLRGLALTSILRDDPGVADAIVDRWFERMA